MIIFSDDTYELMHLREYCEKLEDELKRYKNKPNIPSNDIHRSMDNDMGRMVADKLTYDAANEIEKNIVEQLKRAITNSNVKYGVEKEFSPHQSDYYIHYLEVPRIITKTYVKKP